MDPRNRANDINETLASCLLKLVQTNFKRDYPLENNGVWRAGLFNEYLLSPVMTQSAANALLVKILRHEIEDNQSCFEIHPSKKGEQGLYVIAKMNKLDVMKPHRMQKLYDLTATYLNLIFDNPPDQGWKANIHDGVQFECQTLSGYMSDNELPFASIESLVETFEQNAKQYGVDDVTIESFEGSLINEEWGFRLMPQMLINLTQIALQRARLEFARQGFSTLLNKLNVEMPIDLISMISSLLDARGALSLSVCNAIKVTHSDATMFANKPIPSIVSDDNIDYMSPEPSLKKSRDE